MLVLDRLPFSSGISQGVTRCASVLVRGCARWLFAVGADGGSAWTFMELGCPLPCCWLSVTKSLA